MDERDYKLLYKRLNYPEDIEALAKELDHPKEVVKGIFIQKTIRLTRRRHPIVKKQLSKLRRKWRQGKTFSQLARELRFPPALLASMMLQDDKFTRNEVRSFMRHPETVQKPRLTRELKEALAEDIVYSPKAMEVSYRRGKRVEEQVGGWLTGRNIKYVTEEDSKRNGLEKTPDFLFEKEIDFGLGWVRWVECKATFGDSTEFRRDHKKQLKHYVQLFGPGVVVYWYGFLTGLDTDGVTLVSRRLFKV